jgi:hypothetical protein
MATRVKFRVLLHSCPFGMMLRISGLARLINPVVFRTMTVSSLAPLAFSFSEKASIVQFFFSCVYSTAF